MTEQELALRVVHTMDEDLPTLSMEGSDAWHIEFASRFLAAIDAERSKDAKAWICDYAGGLIRLNGFVSASQKEEGAWRALYLTPRVVPEWKPIETAPKDGTLVLCAGEFDGQKDWRIKIGFWSEHENDWHLFGGFWTPTHWMPLPSSPEDV